MVKYRPVSTSATKGMSLTLLFGSKSTTLQVDVGEYRRDGFHTERSLRMTLQDMEALIDSTTAGVALSELREVLHVFQEEAFVEAREMRLHD